MGRDLLIPRIEDMPYYHSPAIQFVYESEALLSAGVYTWQDTPSVMTPQRPIIDNAVYYFRSLTMSADISELDFTAAIVTTPEFFTFLRGDAQVPHFREPIQMVKFFQNFTYRFLWRTQQANDIIYGAFRGTLLQTASLVGKDSITLKAVISCQEITDENFNERLMEKYPSIGNTGD